MAPGTSLKTNPNAMATIRANTIFTNVGSTSQGGVYWEGIDQDLPPGTTFTSWLGQPWAPGEGPPGLGPEGPWGGSRRFLKVLGWMEKVLERPRLGLGGPGWV